MITEAAAYPDISAEDYHGREICPAPSISATGLKCIIGKSPAHYWHGSHLNPNRARQVDKRHFSVGKAAHDKLLLGERWPAMYHVLSEDFDRRATKRCAAEIAAADDAEAAGLTILKHDDALAVEAMAAALRTNPAAVAALSNGQPEVTLAWTDPETGVWLRARPDFLPTKRQIIPDLKTAADGSPDGFSRAIGQYGYHIAAAHYLAGIEAVFGERPQAWLHIVIEKEPPHVVALWQLPQEDIDRGEDARRRAIRIFADCLSSGKWPGYQNDVAMCGLPQWARKTADFQMENE